MSTHTEAPQVRQAFPSHPTLQGLPTPWSASEQLFDELSRRELVGYIEVQTVMQLRELRAMASSTEDLATLADLDQPTMAADLATQLMERSSQAWEMRALSILAAVQALQRKHA